jgi:hypothetical protein
MADDDSLQGLPDWLVALMLVLFLIGAAVVLFL